MAAVLHVWDLLSAPFTEKCTIGTVLLMSSDVPETHFDLTPQGGELTRVLHLLDQFSDQDVGVTSHGEPVSTVQNITKH